MPIFTYEAKQGPTKRVSGALEARTEDEAIEKIHEKGLIPIKVKQQVQAAKDPEEETQTYIKVRSVKSKDVTIMSQQLSSLLKSGVPIIRCLEIIGEQSESGTLKRIMLNIAGSIREGETLSDSLEKYPAVFDGLYVSMVRAGESMGKLHQVLSRIAEYRRRSEDSMSKTKAAMVYPILMGLVGIGTIIFMMVFVMPRIIKLFGGLGQNLPLPTKVVMWISTNLREQWLFVVIGLLVISITIKQFSRTRFKKKIMSVLGLKLPVIKKFVRMLEFSRFSRTMELLMKSGIPILTTLELAIPTVQNEIIRKKLTECSDDLRQGGTFGQGLKGTADIFPSFMINLIMVAEESGKLEEAFSEIANTYEREGDTALKALMTLIEPMMILVMGLVVGFVVIAMLLPIFELSFTGM
ncbi:MAG: type II secretion system F family protein [Candidatus Omnitrophota bacterium]